MDYLAQIGRHASANMGSVVSIKVVRAADVAAEPSIKDDTMYGSFTYEPGKGFREWKVNAAEMRVRGARGRDGQTKTNGLTFLLPKDRQSVRAMLDLAMDDEFIVIFKDANGLQKVYGTKEYPVLFKYDLNTGGAPADLNSYQCEFYHSGLINDYFYDETVSTAPAGASPAVVRVNGTVVASLSAGQVIDFTTPFDFTFETVGT